MSYVKDESIMPRNVEDEMKESYLRYSMSVIISRALPDVRDGLKPSQRRILFAMRQLSLSPGGKHRKCAKICGDTSGDYHPHGEGVIYPTLVRMAQNWVMRYELVNGQGNFGSVDGDPPAQMRYTEARLTNASMQLMEDLDKDTVDVTPNYDETKKEPTVFPAKFPNLLCNGSSGIAVGMATNIPPHNLHELIEATVLVLENPQTTIDEIMQVMPAPDFPTGGMICGYRGIKEAYHTGRGKLILRAIFEVAEKDEKHTLIVEELPYGVNKANLIKSIADLINSKDITGISDLRDESDKSGLRIVFELKRNEVPDVIINQLYKFTDMQVTFGCNLLALDNGLPRVMNVKQFLSAWIEHRIGVVRRRTRFELNKAEARAHILQGYLKAIDNLDEVVKLIRSQPNKEEAKKELIARFQFSERQASAVLELRLYQLTGLEHDKIQNEYDALLKKIEEYKAILASEVLIRNIIKDELFGIKKYFASTRQTKVVAAEGEFNIEDLIPNEPVIITISEDDYIKRMPIDNFKEQRRGGQGIIGFDMKRESDTLKGFYIANTHNYLLILTGLGRCYWLKAWQIPEGGRRSKGRPLVNLLEDLKKDEKIATILQVSSFDEKASILLVTKRGVIKKTNLDAFSNPRRKGIFALNIDEDDEMITAKLVKENQEIMLFTRCGMAVRFEEHLVRPMGRTARGVRGVTLKSSEDHVVGCEVVSGDENVLVLCEKGFGKRSNVEEFRKTNRGGKGVRSIITSDRNGLVIGALAVTDIDSVVIMSSYGQTVRVRMGDIRVMGRATQGVKVVNLKSDSDNIIAVQKIEGIDIPEAELEAVEVVPTSNEEPPIELNSDKPTLNKD